MFRISGVGCCLLDLIYPRVDFGSAAFQSFRSRVPGDGGLEPGKLVFTDDGERFMGQPWGQALGRLTVGQEPHANVGGPAVVALIGASQLLDPKRFSVQFMGAVGQDEGGADLRRRLAQTPLATRLVERPDGTPFTYVLSDPGFEGGKGERTFVNHIGAAWHFGPEDLDEDFFRSQMVVFGGTALVPRLHDALDELLPRVREAGGFTVVNTVYDFRHQRQDPQARWPLGRSDEAYAAVDLLIADREEALRLSGQGTLRDAVDWFLDRRVGAVLVTDGVHDIHVGASSPLFRPPESLSFPVSRTVVDHLHAHPELRGDTTGCGDNFAGGVIASVALQLDAGASQVSLREAAAWGAACGGLACYRLGGVWTEAFPGEKLARVSACLEADRGLV